MAEGASYPVRLVNSDDKTTAGTTLVFTDSTLQPDTAQVYVQTTDPGAVGPGAIWVNTTSISGTACRPISVRNAADSAWIPAGLAVYTSGVLRGMVTIASDGGIALESRDASAVLKSYILVQNGKVQITGPANGVSVTGSVLGVIAATAGGNAPRLNQLSPLFSTTSGALSTVQLVSGTGAQVSTGRDVETYTPFTTDASNNLASCTVALSADDTTYSTLFVVTQAAALNNLGLLILPITVRVPAGWFLKMTAVHGTIGASTYA